MILNVILLHCFPYLCRQRYKRRIDAFSQQVWRHVCSDEETETATKEAEKATKEAEKALQDEETEEALQDEETEEANDVADDESQGPMEENGTFGDNEDANDQDEDSISQNDSEEEDGIGASLLDSNGYLDVDKVSKDTQVGHVRAALFLAQRKRVRRMVDRLEKAQEALNVKANNVIR